MPVLLVLLSAALFGTTGTAQALGLSGVDPFAVGALRLAAGGLLLGAIALLRTRGRPARGSRITGRAAAAVAVGALGVVAYQPTFFSGVDTNGVAVGTLVALGSAPVLTGACAWAISRRRPETRWFVCTALAVVGVLLLSGLVDPSAGRGVRIEGFVASLAAGASYAVYTLAVKALLDQGWTTVAAVGAVFGAAGLIGVVELVLVGAPALDGRGVLAVAWLGVATIAVAYVLFARGLEHLPAAVVSTLTLAEPVVAGLLGVALLGERLAPVAWLGAALLVAAIALLGMPRRRRFTPVPAEAGTP